MPGKCAVLIIFPSFYVFPKPVLFSEMGIHKIAVLNTGFNISIFKCSNFKHIVGF